MAKRALLNRLSRLELPGRKPKGERSGGVKNPIASLELKVGEQTRRLPSKKAEQEEKIQLEKIKKVESREKALRIIEKFKEKERIERHDSNDRNWRADESDRTERESQAIASAENGWKILRIAGRLLFGLTLLYFGLRGVVNLIDFILHPPALPANLPPGFARPSRALPIGIGIAFICAAWFLQWVRRKLADCDPFSVAAYIRAVLLAWIPMFMLTATLFLSRAIDPGLEAFIRISWVYFYATVMACWFYFLTIV